jgi:hypothetical protein
LSVGIGFGLCQHQAQAPGGRAAGHVQPAAGGRGGQRRPAGGRWDKRRGWSGRAGGASEEGGGHSRAQ